MEASEAWRDAVALRKKGKRSSADRTKVAELLQANEPAKLEAGVQEEQGLGFISSEGGGEAVSIHLSATRDQGGLEVQNPLVELAIEKLATLSLDEACAELTVMARSQVAESEWPVGHPLNTDWKVDALVGDVIYEAIFGQDAR